MVPDDISRDENATAKKRLRAAMRQRLKEEFPPEKSRLDQMLLARLRSCSNLTAGSAIAAYAAFREEPVLTPLLQEWLTAGKHLYLPRFHAESGSYRMVTVRNLERDCVVGKYGISEPAPELPEEEKLAEDVIWLIPGIAFDTAGNRIGRGCGYYDRLLQRHPGGFRIGVCWECQILPRIPAMPWDMRMDAVVTECGMRESAPSL